MNVMHYVMEERSNS